MGDNKKEVDEAQEWVLKSEEAIKNLTNFADNMIKDLPKEEQERLQKELKSIDISDISKTLSSVVGDIDNFNKKYSL